MPNQPKRRSPKTPRSTGIDNFSLADSLLDYLFERSTGHIGSLMTLITRGCARAIRSGAEELTKELLEEVKLDAASEKARQQAAAEVRSSKRRPRKK